MCQMPNIWHIWHTKHKNKPSSAVINVSKFWDMLHYALKYESVWIAMPFWFNVFLFSFLSLSLSISSLSVRSRSLSSLLKISRHLTTSSISTALAVDLHSPRRQPLDLLIESWVWDLGWVLMCGFWVIDWSFGLGFWAGGGVVVVAVVGWVLGWRCLWL